MDYGLWNAIGMTVMAAFGLWVINSAMRKHMGKKSPPDKRGQDQ